MFTGQMMFTQKHNVCRLLCSSAQRVPIMPLGGHICTRPIIISPPAAPTKHQTVITIIKTHNSPALHHHHCHKHFERKKTNKSSWNLPYQNHPTSQAPRPTWWWNFHSGSGNLTRFIPTATPNSHQQLKTHNSNINNSILRHANKETNNDKREQHRHKEHKNVPNDDISKSIVK